MNIENFINNIDEKNHFKSDLDNKEEDNYLDSTLNEIEILKLDKNKILEDNFKRKMLRRELSNVSNLKNSKSFQNIIYNNQNNLTTNVKTTDDANSTILNTNSSSNYRQSVINNFNSWLSEISSGALFQNFILSNPFRKRVSRTPTTISSNITKSNSKVIDEVDFINENDLNISDLDSDSFKMFIGTIKPTLKGNEVIELANFGIVEIDGEEPGLGHKFQFFPLSSHTFCDNCSEFIWTPVIHHSNSISVNISPYSQTVRCINCKYTCHYRCSKFVRINCQKSIDNNIIESKFNDEQDDKKQDLDCFTLFEEICILEQKIAKYNQRIAHKGSGLGMCLLEDKKTFRGFLRVNLNLTRPINVIAGTRPPSIYDIINDEEVSSRRTLTTFYMPRGTVKNIHINSKNSSIDVIKAMLKKFKMVDNHQKFALYKKFTDKNQKTILSRIGDFEYPLKIALEWLDSDEKQFVLQENDTADVNWNEFQLPELRNFLKILDREEKEHLEQVKKKYGSLKLELEKIINYKNIFSDAVYI